jgi:hypothetical protein
MIKSIKTQEDRDISTKEVNLMCLEECNTLVLYNITRTEEWINLVVKKIHNLDHFINPGNNLMVKIRQKVFCNPAPRKAIGTKTASRFMCKIVRNIIKKPPGLLIAFKQAKHPYQNFVLI